MRERKLVRVGRGKGRGLRQVAQVPDLHILMGDGLVYWEVVDILRWFTRKVWRILEELSWRIYGSPWRGLGEVGQVEGFTPNACKTPPYGPTGLMP